MKQTFVLLTAATLFLASCGSGPMADKATTGEAQTAQAATGATYNVDLAQSRVQWTGTKPVGSHTGSMPIKEGHLMVDAGNITGGKFTIDVANLKVEDKDNDVVTKLGSHLKSGDFFEVEKYPTATFEITGVKAGVDSATNKDLVMKDATHTISGNLTMKDVTKSITFPARINVADASVSADANFNIDRTQWGVDKATLKDKLISPTVNIVLHIVANK